MIPSQPTQRLPPPAQPGMPVTGAGNNSPRSRSSKRAAVEPADDPRVENADSPEVITERGSKRAAEFPPEDPRLSEPGQASQVIHDPPTSSVEMDHSRKCAKCLKEFKSKNALHQHLRDAGHQVVDGHDTEEEIDSIEARRSRIQRHRRDQIDHYDKVQKMTGCDVPGAKEESMDSLSSGHPGQKIKRHEILARDLQWTNIGSGVFTRIFPQAMKLMTTSKGGPAMTDIQSRRVWSLSTGKLVDECNIDEVPDHELNRQLKMPDDLRVELIMKQAIVMYEKKGPNVCEIFSQPRVCRETGGRMYAGETLSPGWSLDLTTKDPLTGAPWDLSSPKMQSRVKNLIRDTKPFCVIG